MFFAGDQHHFNIGNHLLASQQLELPAHGEQTSFKRDSIHRHPSLASPSSRGQVSVNGVEVRAVKPGVYRHTITGFRSVLLRHHRHHCHSHWILQVPISKRPIHITNPISSLRI